MVRAALVGLGLVALAARAQTDPPAPAFTNVSVHDPAVLRAGATFYVYGSHLASAKSNDLIQWTQLSTSAAPGNVLVPNPAVTFSEVLTWAQTDTFWAPDAIRLADGKYYLYYCACRGDSPLSAMGLAVADAPTGPFAHVAVLLKSGMAGASEDGTTYNATMHPNVVDPAVFFDPAGKLWMVYGSYSGGIFILQLDPATGRPLAGQGYGRHLAGGNHARIEGAYISYEPDTNYYYLYLSFGGLDAAGGYNVRVARSRQPDGPYVDANGTDLATVKGAVGTLFDDASIAPHGVKLMGGYQFLHAAGEPGSTSRGYVSPGHNSVYRDPSSGRSFLVFHTRFVGRGEQHEVRVHPLYFNTAGWPVVAPHRYAGESPVTFSAADVAGDFKLINHGKAITATVSNSVVVTLANGGSVSGAQSGTWQLADARTLTLTLAGVTYRGVLTRQWDDDNQVWVAAFTALSDNGTAVWGSKVTAANAGPAVGQNLVNETVTTGHGVTFSAGSAAGTIRWQVSTNGGTTWTDLADNSTYSGTATPTLAIANAGTSLDGVKYRFTATNAGSVSTSPAVTLTVAAALLPFPVAIAVDNTGNLLVADSSTNTVQKITAAGVATVLAGSSGTSGSADGTGTSARFNQPSGIVLTASGTAVVADTANATLRSVTSGGAVTTLAGSPDIRGSADGTGAAATFSFPLGLARDSNGTVYVADAKNHIIRKVTSAGAVTTFAGVAGSGGFADGSGTAARFNYPSGVAVDTGGIVYVADTTNNLIRRISPTGDVTTLAGVSNVAGHDDGTGSGALFNQPGGLVVDAAGNLYVADTGNSTIRRVTPAGVVTTLAGLPTVAGLASGGRTSAMFSQPRALAIDGAGLLYVADTGNASIRKVDANGNVTTVALTAGTTPTPTTPTTPTPTTPTPTGGGSGGGGGGGAPTWNFVAALVLLASHRWLRNRQRLATTARPSEASSSDASTL